MTEERRPKGLSRRTLVKGAAWAVPTVPLVAAAPAYAVSGTVTDRFLSACKSPGASCKDFPKGYILAIEICNYTNYPIQVIGDRVEDGLLGGVATEFEVFGVVQTVAKGACATVYIGIDDQGSSPNTSLSGTLYYKYWATAIGEDEDDAIVADVPFSSATAPPCSYPGTPPPSTCPPIS